MIDCRRELQLNYLGEQFSRDQCTENHTSACDNCTHRNEFKAVDVSKQSETIVDAVKVYCSTGRYTVLMMVDLFKGAKTQKMTESGLINSKYYGYLKK